MKEKQITIPIYNFDITIIHGEPEDVILELEDRHKGLKLSDYVGDQGNHFTLIDNNVGRKFHYLIFYGEAYIITIYHESGHLAWELLESRRCDVSYENQEPLFYIQDYIAEKVLETIKEWNDG